MGREWGSGKAPGGGERASRGRGKGVSHWGSAILVRY